jgi:hypothetical protein
MLQVLTGVLERNTNNTAFSEDLSNKGTVNSFPRIVVGMNEMKTLGWAGHVTHMKETGKV